MPIYREIPSQLTYKPTDISPTSVPTFRIVEGAQPDTISRDQAEQWAVNPFARAPQTSDLERRLFGLPSPRSTLREDSTRVVTEYQESFDRRASASIHRGLLRSSALAAPLLIPQAAEAISAGSLADNTTLRLLGLGVTIAGLVVHVDRINVGHDRILQQECEDATKWLLDTAEKYPAQAQASKVGLSGHALKLRTLLDENGLDKYIAACDSSDLAMPAYLKELARMNTPNIVNRQFQGYPTAGFLPDRSFSEAASLTNITHYSKQLLAPTVREFSYLAMANNQAEASSSRSHVG